MAETTAPPAPSSKHTSKLNIRSARTWSAFRTRVQELGGTVLEPVWKGSDRPHRVRCREGHESAPTPNNVLRRRRGICRVCAGQDPHVFEAAFRAKVDELGGVITGAYVNSNTPLAMTCRQGHECAPLPTVVMQKGRITCRVCAGQDPKGAETAFRARVSALGGTVVGVYVNSNTPVLVQCAQGHECRPRPASLQKGQGICRTCAGLDPRDASARFHTRVTELGGSVLGDYVNWATPVLVRCARGHECSAWPSDLRRGRGFCIACMGLNRRAASAFQARVQELGGTVIGEYVNNLTPVRVRCPEGHQSAPIPNNVLRGTGICRSCAGRTWDVLYVVQDDAADLIKFGITSGDPRPRLADHVRDGFDRVIRLYTGLPGDTAPRLEQTVLAALHDAGEQPARGLEYFPSYVLAVVLDIVDNHPDICG